MTNYSKLTRLLRSDCMGIRNGDSQERHCEERSDDAISYLNSRRQMRLLRLRLAMTDGKRHCERSAAVSGKKRRDCFTCGSQ